MFEISGGELQLCYVARSIVQEANILVMDEPCTFLDYEKQYRRIYQGAQAEHSENIKIR